MRRKSVPWTIVALLALAAGIGDAAAERVPFVGCASDGQTGPNEPPRGAPIDIQGGEGLAYYADGFIGVLAPRGWSCFGTYGSSGSTLFVAPTQLNSKIVMDSHWQGIPGDGIQASQSLGDTSGRFSAAAIAARVFPSKRDYVQRVIDEGLLPASNFPFGPYPGDRLMYKSDLIVEYETPAHSTGLGTLTRLRPNDNAIRGVALFGDEESGVFQLAARLPRTAQRLLPIILQKFEKDYGR
jgi:hypothetical protein